MIPRNAVRRFWRPQAIARVVVPLVLALVALGADRTIDDLNWLDKMPAEHRAVHWALVFIAALFVIYAVRAFTEALSGSLDAYLGMGRARSLTTVVSIVLYLIVVLGAVNAAGINLSGFLVGGALTGVIVGIAGQASLSNIIAGLVLLFARPYTPGMYITARAGAFGGVEYSGQVWDISLFHTTLRNDEQQIRIPNSVMIGAVVVLRPEEIAVYLPVTLQRAATPDAEAAIARLRQCVEESLPRVRTVRVTLESVTADGYVAGVRAFVASERERQAVERAITSALAAMAPPEESKEPIETGDQDDSSTGTAEVETEAVGARH